MIFKLETLSQELLDESFPLFIGHFKEISANQDIPLEPDFEQYYKLEEMGMLRFFSARNDQGKLLGYAVFMVRNNLHYKSSKQAVQDIIYISPHERGFGAEFIEWCDAMLKAEGVQLVYHHVKAAHNWGKVLDRLGYRMIEFIYSKRLDLWQQRQQ